MRNFLNKKFTQTQNFQISEAFYGFGYFIIQEIRNLIPMMISGYFNDMEIVIKNLSKIIKDNGYFIMDIGDSQFAGIHIPTHEILIKICEKYGFCLYEDEVLRERRSKNGMVLSQRLLKFKL